MGGDPGFEGCVHFMDLAPELDPGHAEITLPAFLQVGIEAGVLFGAQLAFRDGNGIGCHLPGDKVAAERLEAGFMRDQAYATLAA